jgi:hypothetical protein
MKCPLCIDKHIGMTNIKNNRHKLTLATYSFYGRPSIYVYIVNSIKVHYYKYLFCSIVFYHRCTQKTLTLQYHIVVYETPLIGNYVRTKPTT